MAAADRLDDDQVHVLHEARRQRSRLPMLVGLVLIVAVAGAGAWVALTDPFGAGGAPVEAVPAADNLLGEAWSFESAEGARPDAAWQVADGAPSGFRAGSTGVVSGAAAGVADVGSQGWARSVSAEAWRVEPGSVVELSGVSAADGTQLFARFLADDRPPLDVPLASGRGRLAGRAAAPPGYRSVRAGLGAVGSGVVDDLVLRLLPQGDAQTFERSTLGIFEVLAGPALGALALRGQELVLAVRPPAVRPEGVAALPGPVGFMPSDEGAGLRLADDTFVTARVERALVGKELQLRSALGGLPAGATVLHEVLVLGSLAAAPVGIRTAGGYELFSGDFRVEGVDALVLGRTQDRCELRLDRPFAASASHRDDGSVALTLELPAGGASADLVLGLTADFSEQRVAAVQLRDEADRAEAAGRLGDALAALDRILADYPYDEQVLAEARRHRGELTQALSARLDALDADLDVALFLGSAQRCNEVRQDALAAAAAFAGSDAEALFRERAEQVATRGASLLASDLERRRARIEALRDSFATGGYPSVAAELSDYLERFLDGHEGDAEDGR